MKIVNTTKCRESEYLKNMKRHFSLLSDCKGTTIFLNYKVFYFILIIFYTVYHFKNQNPTFYRIFATSYPIILPKK